MKYEHTDGTITIGFSSCCCPPGEKRKGQHTNACTDWYRIDWKDGTTTGWLHDPRHSQTRIYALAANDCKDFQEAMAELRH